MPHTSRRRPRPDARTGTTTTKKTKHGRTLVSSPDGWTHVLPSTYPTTTSSASALTASSFASSAPLNAALPTVEPAEAPSNTSDSTALATHSRYVSRLRDTAFWKATEWQARTIITRRPFISFPFSSGPDTTTAGAAGDEEDERIVIRKAILFGLGSPTGLCRGGMVDRRRVAGWQLAWFVEVVRLVEHLQGAPLEEKLAQEPLYNAHDIRLHNALGIEVLDSPQAFDRLTNQTLVFAPGAEREVLRRIFKVEQRHRRHPAVFIGNWLNEEEEEEVLMGKANARCREGGEVKGKARMQRWELPRFEEEDESVFWGMGMYWDWEDEDKGEGEGEGKDDN